jgi:hypothetical protein
LRRVCYIKSASCVSCLRPVIEPSEALRQGSRVAKGGIADSSNAQLSDT